MHNAEWDGRSSSRDGDTSGDTEQGGRALAQLPAGTRCRISWIAPSVRNELVHEGLRPGCLVTVGSRTPLGGPIVITASRARLAISRDVARLIRVRPEPGS